LKDFLRRTELVDLRVVAVDAFGQDQRISNADAEVSIGGYQFRSEPGKLYVRFTTTVNYQGRGADQPEPPDTDSAPTDHIPLGRIQLTHLAELSLTGDHTSLSQGVLETLVEQNLFFIVFPYIREAIQRYAQELGLPPTTLPILRRPVA
jgi:hypothetical protein